MCRVDSSRQVVAVQLHTRPGQESMPGTCSRSQSSTKNHSSRTGLALCDKSIGCRLWLCSCSPGQLLMPGTCSRSSTKYVLGGVPHSE
jgi:hypothetical protein